VKAVKIRKDQLEDSVRELQNKIALAAIDDRIAQDSLKLQQAIKEKASKATKDAIIGSMQQAGAQRNALTSQQKQTEEAAKIKQAQDEITRAHAATVREIEHQNNKQ
jgi:hypothetical protein